MGIDCGFDIHPRLEPTSTNKEAYERFLIEILDKYEDDNKVRPRSKTATINFTIGERPSIPYKPKHCQYFIRFSSQLSGTFGNAEAENYVRAVCEMAKKHFGGARALLSQSG